MSDVNLLICPGEEINNESYSSVSLSRIEIESTQIRMVTLCHVKYYKEEYEALTQKTVIRARSSLLTLNPFLDEQAVSLWL